MTGTDTTLHRVARGGALNLFGAVVGAFLGVALVAVITNGYGKDTAGTLFATTSAFLIAVSVVQLGTEVGLVKWMPARVAAGDHAALRPTLRTALVPVTAVSVAVAAMAYAAAPALASVLGDARAQDEVVLQIRLLAVFVPIASLYNVLLAATRGMRTMQPTVVVESIGRNVVQLLAVAAVQVAGLGVAALVLAWVAPYVLALVAAALWLLALLQQLGARHGAGTAAPAAARTDADDLPSTGIGRSFWDFTAPRAVSTIAQVILKRADIVLVAALRSPAEAALYMAATRFVVVGQLGVQALQQTLSPHLAGLFAGDRSAEAQDLYKTTTTWSMLLAWPMYLVMAVTAPLLLRFFGPGYDAAADVVVILCLAMLLATACGSVDTVLLMSGRSWLSLTNALVAVAVNIGLNVLLLPRMGITGAAIAWAAAIAVRNLLPLVQIRLSLQMSPIGRGPAYAALLSVGCFGVLPGVLVLADAGWPAVIGVLVLGTVAYAGLVWRLRGLLRLDAFRAAVTRRPASRGKRGRVTAHGDDGGGAHQEQAVGSADQRPVGAETDDQSRVATDEAKAAL